MATKKPVAAAAATSAVAVKKTPGSNIVSIKEQMAADLAKLQDKTAAPSGLGIRVTQDKKFILPNGVTTPGPLELVIVDFNSQNRYYIDDFDPKNITPPTCFAIHSNPTMLVRSDNSPEPQSDGCAACPMNQFGTAKKGGGKACKNSRVLAVLPPDADEGTPLWTLSTSPTANKGFDGYVNDVARRFQVPPYGVVTTVSFNPNETYASLVFGDPKPNESVEVAYSRREEAAKLLAVEPDVSSYEAAAPAPKKAATVRRK